MPKYGAISGPYFPVFSPDAEKYGPEITPYSVSFQSFAKFGTQNLELGTQCFIFERRRKL